MGEFTSRLSFALMGFIARQLRVAEEAIPPPPMGDTPMHECVPLGGKPFTEIELAEWDKEEAEEPLFVGPIRL